MDKIKITVWTQHEASPGIDAYAAEAFTAEVSLDGHADHAQLMASNMVSYIAQAYRGDRISLRVDQPRRGRTETFCFLGIADGTNEHGVGISGEATFEPTIERIAFALERC